MGTDQRTADYGYDAPGIVMGLGGSGLALLALAWLLPRLPLAASLSDWRQALIGMGVPLFLCGLGMVLYSRFGKFYHRDRMLALVPWTGDEQVLDVGTGKGVLLIGAAHRLKTGKAVGIDIWSAKDLSGNTPENTLANARAEGVAAQIEVRSEDAREMSFADRSFDRVVSNLCLHNIPSAEGRAKAVSEIARVLKPGGVALISDMIHTQDYARVLASHGLQLKKHGPFFLSTFPPLTILQATKPSA
jgi:SAM-dependent methyltransferase